jgi:hypothetical protein
MPFRNNVAVITAYRIYSWPHETDRGSVLGIESKIHLLKRIYGDQHVSFASPIRVEPQTTTTPTERHCG